ncbi:MAG: ABC transporter permease [Nanoarchaeota archaeon]
MNQLWLLTKKNFKLLVRAKSSALILFFAPLLIILILGLSYNNSAKFGLNIGIYSPQFTEDVNSLASSLQEKEFKIVKYDSSINDCIEDIKLGFIHACVAVPSSLRVEENSAKEITYYLDPSKINLVYMVQETLENKFALKSREISQELTNSIITKITEAKTKVGEKSSELSAVKEKNALISSSTDSIMSSLASLDLTPPSATYDPSVIAAFRENVSSGIKNSISKIDEAKEAVAEANISNGKTAIVTALSQADAALQNTFNTINGSGAGSLEEVTAMITLLEQELSASKSKLTSASTSINDANAQLSSTKSALGESISSLERIQNGLLEVKAGLEAQKVTEAGVISAPLVTKIEKVGTGNSYLNFIFPALLVLVVMFSSLLLGTTLVMMEKNSPAFFRNYFLPVKKWVFVCSIYLTNSIITLIQVVIILGVSLFFLKLEPLLMLPVALILIIASSIFTFMGMGIGYLFKSEETGTLASISLGSLLLFISGVVLPLESISPTLRKITFFNPYVIAEKIVREMFFFNASFEFLWVDILTLVGYALVLFMGILILEVLLQKHLIDHFIKTHHRDKAAKLKV